MNWAIGRTEDAEEIDTYVFHLLVHVSDLEPDIDAGQRVRWAAQYTLEALSKYNIRRELQPSDEWASIIDHLLRDFAGTFAAACK